VLPIVITPLDERKPVRFRLQVGYGVSADICIPAEATLELEIPPSAGGAFRKDIAAALERVPKRQARGVYCPHRVITVKRRAVNGRPCLSRRLSMRARPGSISWPRDPTASNFRCRKGSRATRVDGRITFSIFRPRRPWRL